MKKIGIIAGASFLAGAIFFALTFGYIQKDADNRVTLTPPITKAETAEAEELKPVKIKGGIGVNFAPLVKRVRGAVVRVASESLVERRRSFLNDDMLDRFFRTPGRNRQERVSGMGSGFFISPDGYILTNNHVVENAIKIKIIDINENVHVARKVGADPKTDLALLKIDVKDVKGQPYIRLGDSDKLEVGEWVLAIGNPLGQHLSVTSGIVSAKGRKLQGLEVDYQNFIQTDAAINQGNSGGPLVNMEGKAIGINSVILSTSGGNIGIGFAIPSNMAKKVIDDLKREGRVVRGYIGVRVSEVPDSEADDYDVPTGGVLIMKVDQGTPAQKAGLERYDVVVAIGGKKVKTAMELSTIVANHSPGDTVTLTLYRGKKKMEIPVKIAESPESMTIRGSEEGGGRLIDLGMVLQNNNRDLAREFELSTTDGAVVTQVDRGGVASRHQLRVGDVIVGVNRTIIESVNQFRETISRKSGSQVLLTIVRGTTEFFVRFRVPQ